MRHDSDNYFFCHKSFVHIGLPYMYLSVNPIFTFGTEQLPSLILHESELTHIILRQPRTTHNPLATSDSCKVHRVYIHIYIYTCSSMQS